jgi:hypothetical protein
MGLHFQFRPIAGPAAEHPTIIRPHLPALGDGRGAWLRENAAARSKGNAKLLTLKNKHRGQRAFILGNGPSIRRMNLKPLANEVTFAVNASFRLFSEYGWVAPYTCFSDRVRWMEMGATALSASPGSQFFYMDDWEVPTPHTLFTPEQLDRVILVDQGYRLPRALHRWMFLANRAGVVTYAPFARRTFSPDPLQGVCKGNSVIFLAAQMAAYLGCNPVILLGVDMDYSGPVKHFHDSKVWTPPMDYERDAKPWFLRFRDGMARNGVEFLNGTDGGKVDCLRRVNYRELVEEPAKAHP